MSDNNDIDLSLDLEDVTAGDYSLESILAEYKGSAYINGDKKTPPDILNEQTERILQEVVGSAKSGLLFSTNTTQREIEMQSVAQPDEQSPIEEKAPDEARNEWVDDMKAQMDSRPREGLGVDRPKSRYRPGLRQKSDDKRRADAGAKDSDAVSFENYRHPEPESHDSIVQHVEEAIEREYGEPVARERAAHSNTELETGRPETLAPTDFDFFDRPEKRFEEELVDAEEEEYIEPDFKDAARRFAESCNSMSLRCIPSTVITFMMVILTFAYEAGLRIPFGIKRDLSGATGLLMILLLVVMILCADIIVKGAIDLRRGVPNAETLILFSCGFSFISGVYTMLSDASGVLPYCAVSALSLTFAAFGTKSNLRAITDTLKTATASSEPYGVLAEYNKEIDKTVLKKMIGRTDGFYNNLVHPDVSETAYRFATPVLLAAALVLTVFTMIFKGSGANFLHILSALLAAVAPFSAMVSFSLPFGIVAKSIRRSGAALAGWGGADDVCNTNGASVTDEDLFPPGTIALGGMKLFDGISPEKAIRYTSSLIIASGSGLSRVFTEVLKSQSMSIINVDDFACYETGVSALIRGERVMTGSSAFMDLLGIRVPDELNMKNAVFTAINNKLAAMFVVEYTPANSVQGALISILKWRVKLFFAVRDFNVTPVMLEQKFRVSLDDIEYPQARDSYSISDSLSDKEGRMAAVLTRDGFGPFAEAVTGGMLLRTAALFATGVSVFSAAFGLIIMFYMCWTGLFVSARPGNLILFMLAMFAIVLFVCGYAKVKK